MSHLLIELAICAAMTVALSTLHMLGLMWLVQLIRFHIEHWTSGRPVLDRVAVPLTMVSGLFLLHGAEIWLYALVHMRLSGLTFEAALYGSTAAYTTVDIQALDDVRAWRLVAAHEALVGMLLIGWSTAFLFSTLNRIMHTEESYPLPEGAIAEPPDEEDQSV
jgi:voltage-gated potassium channel